MTVDKADSGVQQATPGGPAAASIDSADGPAVADIEESAAELRATLSAVYRAIRASKAFGGLTLPESSALSRLSRHGPMTAARLAREEQITPQSMGATVRSLIDAGLVRRTHDPADGRRLILEPTEEGRAHVQLRRAARGEQLTRALAALDAEERERLRAALPVLARLAREL